MLYAEVEGAGDVVLPVIDGLIGEAVHQVDTDVANACLAQSSDGLSDLPGRMAAMEEA